MNETATDTQDATDSQDPVGSLLTRHRSGANQALVAIPTFDGPGFDIALRLDGPYVSQALAESLLPVWAELLAQARVTQGWRR